MSYQPSPTLPSPPTLSAALAIGFGAAVCVWVLAWFLHLPGIDAPGKIVLPILSIGQVVTTAVMLRAFPAPGRMKAAIFAGLVTGLSNLLITGSVAAEQVASTDQMAESANRLGPNAWLILPGTVLLAVAAAAVAALLAKGGHGRADTPAAWIARFGVVTTLVYLPLIAIGGVVTSTESGMAVPDAVTTYGALSILFPLELMSDPRIFFEHSHRLFGTLAGLVTLALMVRVLASGSTKLSKVLAVVLFLAVCAQGAMGALRVSEISTPIAISHGMFGQAVFALSAVLAATLSGAWTKLSPDSDRADAARKGVKLAIVMLAALFLQLAMGAAARHLGHMDPPSPGAGHARLTHVGFSFVVMALVVVVGAMAIRAGKAGTGWKGLRLLGVAMHGVVTVQFLLGWAALGLVSTQKQPTMIPTAEQLPTADPIRPAEALVTTLHQATGAILLLLCVLGTLWLVRLASRRAP
jgi:heme a synthase